MSSIWILVGVVAVLLLLWVIGIFNKLIVIKNRVANAWSDITVQLKRRYDLIPNLIATVKGYATHESSVFETVTSLRANAMNQTTVEGKAEAENQLSGALKSLFAVSENYPELKASEQFLNLQKQLSSLEDDISSARKYYNATAREMNDATQVFPTNIVAGMFAFKTVAFFQAEEKEKANVNVSF